VAQRTVAIAVAGGVGGLVLAAITGIIVLAIAVPAAALVLPGLLRKPDSARAIRKAEALAEWTGTLSGALGTGAGIEGAIESTLRVAPEEIRPELAALVVRLRQRGDTEAALRQFADDVHGGDLVAANLILAARQRSRALSSVLQAVAKSANDDVEARRQVEAAREKPRGAARLVVLISLGMLAYLLVNGQYLQPYTTPLGQLILVVLLSGFVGALVWLRKLTESTPAARFLVPDSPGGAR
jgi:Flp pilus assembly protein TadB